MKLSVVIITRNEEAGIRRCLESVKWADEIVVLDSHSTDATVQICREYTQYVHETDWPGFGAQKNRALQRATGDWVLSLDADEQVTPELRDEIRTVLSVSAGPDAYELPRLSNYCGRFMRHGGWWPDHVTRLFRRGKAHFSDDLVHEKLIVNGATGRLGNHLVHLAFENFEEVLHKIDRYSTASAEMLRDKGRSGSLSRALLHGLWTFLRTYVFKAGFLDGRHGFMLAVSNAEGTYYRYLKLMLLNEKK
ncbi:MAG: glycosyltransferase family 2 protein [Betaproteobacteria bacterium]